MPDDADGILYFSNGMNITIHNAMLNNTCINGSEVHAKEVINVKITVIKSRHSQNSGSICLFPNMSGTIDVINSTFILPGSSCSFKKYNYLWTFLDFGEHILVNTLVRIEHCIFQCGNVLTVYLAASSSLTLNEVFADGCAVQYGCFNTFLGAFSINGDVSMITITSSTFRDFSTAVVINNSTVTVNDSTFIYNTAIDLTIDIASGLSLLVSNGVLSNVTFCANGNGFISFEIQSDAPAFSVYWSSLLIHECHFLHNYGHALFSDFSNLTFSGRNEFIGNRGAAGVAIYLNVDGASNNMQYTESQIIFESNVADYTGGAIQIAGVNSLNPICPFNRMLLPSRGNLSQSGNLYFKSNSGLSAGDDIYGGYLDQGIAGFGDTRCIEVIRQTSTFDSGPSSISSKPSRVCLCDDEHQNKPDCLNVFSTTEAYPGEDIYLSVVAVGQTFGTSAGFVNAQLLFLSNIHLGNEQQYQVVEKEICTDLMYTIKAEPGIVILVLTTTTELIQNYGDIEAVEDSIEVYNENNRAYVPKLLLNVPVYINVTLHECPPGFKLSASPHECICDKRILDIDGVECHISNRQLERSSTVWIGNDNGSQVVLFSKYCPYNYCKSETVNIFNHSDLQCQMNHTGRLCGQCPVGTSLTLGISRCKQCSNSNLYLLVPFAVSGVVIVIFLKLSDLTTAGGLINGLILYANLVKAGSYIYFPATSSTHLDFFRVFIDWLNLDLGIETCFFDGLTGYWKAWLQFVFPLYIWAIALSMILMARYNIRMARLLGNNSVPVLATLFLLSYAKLFRVINTAMKFTILENVNGTTTAVWSYDGSIDYFNLRHSILLIVAILVLIFLWLPYTCVLLFVQCLQRCSVQKINSFVSRMQPFLDAHCGPFKDCHRYWFGVLLIARAIPLLIGTVGSTNSDRNTILSTIAVIGITLVFQSRVYRKLYVSISESLFLLNLLFLAGSALYALSIGSEYHNSQEVFTAVLVGFAFLHFIVIAIFSTARHFRMIRIYRNWIPVRGVNTLNHDSYERSHSNS